MTKAITKPTTYEILHKHVLTINAIKQGKVLKCLPASYPFLGPDNVIVWDPWGKTYPMRQKAHYPLLDEVPQFFDELSFAPLKFLYALHTEYTRQKN